MRKIFGVLAALLISSSAFAQAVAPPSVAQGAGPITTPFGEQFSSPTPQKLFGDTFDVSQDLVFNWQTPVFAGAGAAAAVDGGGNRVIQGSTAANGYSYVVAKPTFPLASPGFIVTGSAIKIPASIPTNTYWFWGSCTPQSVPTAANPIAEGIVFEIQPGGKMFAASYAGGARTIIADLSAVTGRNQQPLDGVTHFYYNFTAGNLLSWAIDNLTPSGYVNVQYNGVNGPNINTQGPCQGVVNGTSAPSAAPVMTVAASWVATTGTSGWLSDGGHPFIKATVKLPGSFPSPTTDNPLVVSPIGADPCTYAAKSSVPINITTAATTALVAVSGTTSVYVCGISLTISEVITTPNTIIFEQGTGAACAGSPVALTGKYGDGGVTAGIPIVVGQSAASTIFKGASANGICGLTAIGATGSFQGVMTYVQQ